MNTEEKDDLNEYYTYDGKNKVYICNKCKEKEYKKIYKNNGERSEYAYNHKNGCNGPKQKKTNQNSNATINSQIYESIGGLFFNYAKQNDNIKNLNKMSFDEKYIYILNILKNEDISKYYIDYNDVNKDKYEKMKEYILNNIDNNNIIEKKIKTSIILLGYYLKENEKSEINKILWYGENCSEERTTTDVIIIYNNNKEKKISLKEGKSHYLLNSTFIKFINYFNNEDNYNKFNDDLLQCIYSKFLSKKDLKIVCKLLDKNNKKRFTNDKKRIKGILNTNEKTDEKKYQKYYIKKQKKEIEYIKNNFKHMNFKKFLKEQIINPNKDVKLLNLINEKKNKLYKFNEKLENIISFLNSNIENNIEYLFINHKTQVSNFYIIMKFESKTIEIECSLRSDQSINKGHKLAQYNNKFNILKITMY